MLHRSQVSLALVASALVVGAAPSSAMAAQEIEGQYIVVLKEQAGGEGAKKKARSRGGKVQREFSRVLNGFSAELDAKALAEVRKDPAVDYVEPDRVITLSATQNNPPWGLDRIDQRDRPLSGTYTYDRTGAGVKAYIVDTGILATHNDFGGRVIAGFSAISGGTTDCNGHGTHVAGTVGGSTYGVAKGVTLVPVRVLGCNGSGSTSGVISGIDWVAGNHPSGEPAVANMSLGGSASTALDDAVQRAITDGVTFAVAAGNESQNACNVSPARAPNALTVGATTSTDARASYSNYGTCVDLFAPGSSILSAWYSSNTASNTISGTSMASPHVAGAAALVLQATPAASPATVRSTIVGAASSGKVSNPGSGSPNLLLYAGPAGGNPDPDPDPDPDPEPPCAAVAVTGSLSGSGASAVAAGPFTAAAGAHKGCLTGAGTDFDLYLDRQVGGYWYAVAAGERSSSTETVNYNGPAGTYRWRVRSYRGSGAFTLQYTRP